LTIDLTDNIKCHLLQSKYILEFLFIQIRHNTTAHKILVFESVWDCLLYVYEGYICCLILTVFHILHLQINYKKGHKKEKCESKLNYSASIPKFTIQADVLIIQLLFLIAIYRNIKY